MKKKICIVGCGGSAKVHANNLARHCQLYFCSRKPQDAQRYADKFGGAGTYNSFEEALNDTALDALMICSPPQQHLQQVVAALQRGQSLMVDKPLCLSSDELGTIERCVKQSATKLFMIGENYYYKPSVRKIVQLIAKGHIGRIESIHVNKVFEQAARGWKAKLGALLEGGVHFIALISAIVDQTPTAVEATFPNKEKDRPERHSLTKLHYQHDLEATLHYAWDRKSLSKGLFQHSFINGTLGRIVFESNGLYIWLHRRGKQRLYLPDFYDIAGFKSMAKDFLDCLHNQTQPLADLSTAVRDLNIVFTAYKSMHSAAE